MTAREIIDIVRESALWDYLSISEKKDALVYAVKSIQNVSVDKEEQVDIADIVGEVFRA